VSRSHNESDAGYNGLRVIAAGAFRAFGVASLALTSLPAFADPLTSQNAAVAPAATASDAPFWPALTALGRSVEGGFVIARPPAFSVAAETLSGATFTQVDHALYGAYLGLSMAWLIGEAGDTPLFLESNSSFSLSLNSTNSATLLSAMSSPTLSVGTAPSGALSVTTSTAGGNASSNVSASVTDPTGDTATASLSISSVAGGGQISNVATSSTTAGGVFVAATTNGSAPTAAGYAANYDGNGFTFTSSGDVGASQLETTITDQQLRLGQEFLFSMPVTSTQDWTFSLKAGPRYEFTQRALTRREVINIEETISSVSLPLIGISTSDTLSTNSLGLMAGIGGSTTLSDQLQIGFGVNLGVSAYRAQHDFTSRVEGLNTGQVPARTTSQAMTGVTTTARASIDFGYRVSPAGTLSLSVFGEERFGVPTLTRTGSTTTITTGNEWGAGIGLAYSLRF
jgi:hypothetical protein